MAEKKESESSAIAEGLTNGLLLGFGGASKFEKIERGGAFSFHTSHVETQTSVYHDEWLATSVGGGQEVFKEAQCQFTRLYAGGVVSADKLAQLGIGEDDVIEFLKSVLLSRKSDTRLFQNCREQQDAWTYEYQVVCQATSVAVTVGKETIAFKGEEVFVHMFLLCPIA